MYGGDEDDEEMMEADLSDLRALGLAADEPAPPPAPPPPAPAPAPETSTPSAPPPVRAPARAPIGGSLRGIFIGAVLLVVAVWMTDGDEGEEADGADD